MKRIIFIDNDNVDTAIETVKKNVLSLLNKNSLQLTAADISIIPDFSNRNSDDNYNLLFDQKNIIVTWSMFTDGGSVSLTQLRRFMKAAGSYHKKDLIYIDTGSYLKRACEDTIRDSAQRDVANFMKGIQNNFIISCDYNGCNRLRIDFSKDGFIREEPIILNDLLNIH